MDFIHSIDTQLFYFVNHDLKNAVFDVVMPFITTTKNFYILFLLLFLALLVFGRGKTRVAVLTIVLGTFFSDFLCSKVLKEIFARPRPFETLQNVNQLVGAAGFSFPSAHAFNSFAAATLFSLFFRVKIKERFKKSIRQLIADYVHGHWVGIVAYFCAFWSAFSRIYVGVHYPFDALGGAIIGILIGWLIYKITTKIFLSKTPENGVPHQ